MRKNAQPPENLFPDYRRAAIRRLDAARHLALSEYRLEAVYLAGYAVECMLKAWIVRSTPKSKHSQIIQLFRGNRGHSFEFLRKQLWEMGCLKRGEAIPEFHRVSGWSTDFRYAVKLPRAQDMKTFLDAAARIVNWIE